MENFARMKRVFRIKYYIPAVDRLEYLAYFFLNVYIRRAAFYRPANKNLLSVVVVTYNSAGYLDNALWLFECNDLDKDVEIIIIDNNSSDKEYLRKYEQKNKYRVVYNKENLKFTRAANQGMKLASGGYVLLLNPDVAWDKNLKTEPLVKMLAAIESDKDIGGVGLLQKRRSGVITFWEGRIFNNLTGRQLAPGEVFVKWRKGIYNIEMLERRKKVEWNYERTVWAWGSIFLIKREMINQIGFLPYNKTCVHNFSEVIYCQIAAYNKWRTTVVKDCHAYHPSRHNC